MENIYKTQNKLESTNPYSADLDLLIRELNHRIDELRDDTLLKLDMLYILLGTVHNIDKKELEEFHKLLIKQENLLKLFELGEKKLKEIELARSNIIIQKDKSNSKPKKNKWKRSLFKIF